jgi:tetratricopeptide (TPR) repeat protein
LRSRISVLLLLAAALFASSCADTSLPPPVVAPPSGEARYLVDPRLGAEAPRNPKTAQAFEAAWRYILAGDTINARKRLTEIHTIEPDYVPAVLAEAALALHAGRLDEARAAIDRARSRGGYTAVDIYEAELAIAENQSRRAFELYRGVVARPDAPAESRERFAQLEKQMFEQLFHDAQSASGAESIRLLREVLAINPSAMEPRILLAQRLVAAKNFDEARRELEPILDSAADRAEVQEALAEIDAGRGRYQEALVRYERLQRRSPNERYSRRLDEIKEQFAAANMPPQYQRAFESDSIDRGDFAVLLYWKVASVRFAQNLGAPPIATDISEVPGREELIRAIAVGVLQVDPITRRVNPGGDVNAGSFARLAARVLNVRGAACARGASDAVKTLAACGISDPSLAGADTPVSGQAAAALLEQIERVLSRP